MDFLSSPEGRNQYIKTLKNSIRNQSLTGGLWDLVGNMVLVAIIGQEQIGSILQVKLKVF